MGEGHGEKSPLLAFGGTFATDPRILVVQVTRDGMVGEVHMPATGTAPGGSYEWELRPPQEVLPIRDGRDWGKVEATGFPSLSGHREHVPGGFLL